MALVNEAEAEDEDISGEVPDVDDATDEELRKMHWQASRWLSPEEVINRTWKQDMTANFLSGILGVAVSPVRDELDINTIISAVIDTKLFATLKRPEESFYPESYYEYDSF